MTGHTIPPPATLTGKVTGCGNNRTCEQGAQNKEAGTLMCLDCLMKSGDRISWQYTHHLNRRNSVERIKHGIYYGSIKHTDRWGGEQLALVLFDGNKRTSRVPIKDVRNEK
jgi:hypothetical protein